MSSDAKWLYLKRNFVSLEDESTFVNTPPEQQASLTFDSGNLPEQYYEEGNHTVCQLMIQARQLLLRDHQRFKPFQNIQQFEWAFE